MITNKVCVVTGAGGFIGGHLAKRLRQDGNFVVGVDIKEPDYRPFTDVCSAFIYCDLRTDCTDNLFANIQDLTSVKSDEFYVFALAADMGGMGFISCNDAQILRNNLLINLNTIEAARKANVARYFFASSVCVYPEKLQMGKTPISMQEGYAYPASPQDAYGWEKLTSENLCLTYNQDYGFDVRIARFHNTYGPYGTYYGGREKAPAALCRKAALSKLAGNHPITITVWGDGEQIRPFIYVNDTVEGIVRLMESDYNKPVNIGPCEDELIKINHMAMMIAGMAGADNPDDVQILHADGPEGVRVRGTNNSLMKHLTGWEPQVKLHDGLYDTYKWIAQQIARGLDDGVKYE